MPTRSLWLVSVATVLLLTGCAQAPPPAPPDTREADAQAIRALEANWVQAFSARDADRIASFWAEDASVLFPNMTILSGREAAKASLAEMIADPNFYLTFTSTKVEVSRAGDYAYSQGTYTMAATDPKTQKDIMTEKGKYVTVYRKESDGSWKAVADINNADGPATIAPAKLVTSGS